MRLLTVLTFNTGNDLIDAGNLVATIVGSRAGIAGLQELSPKNAEVLERSLHDELPHRLLYGEYFNGKGLLSRYPVLEDERFTVPSGRSFLRAVLRIEGRAITVFVAHPPPPDPRRLEVAASPYSCQDVRALLDCASLDTPTLLVGDFNCVSANRSYRLLRNAGLIDTFRAAGRGPGLTYPVRHQYAPIPLPRMMRLDYIWATEHFHPVESVVLKAAGSDHRPLMSVLHFERDGAALT